MKKLSLPVKIFIGLVLGIVVGLIFQSSPEVAITYIKPLGVLFLNLIKMVIVPLVLSSLVVGSASTGDVGKLGRIGIKTLAYFLITTALAVTLGLFFANILQPGLGLSIPLDATTEAGEIPSMLDTLLNIVPTNPIQAMAEANMLQIIIFALFLGISITLVGDKAKPFFDFFDSMAEVCYKIVAIIMEFGPIGVFGLIAPVVAEHGASALLPLLKVIIAVYLSCIVHAVVVYSGAVYLFTKMNPIMFFKGAAPAMMLAFTTSSSSGTLPITMKCTEENLGVPKSISSFVLPLGATINMDGTALYQGVCALFVAQVYGLDLNLAQQMTVVLTATLASIGTAGVPGGGLIMLTMVLQSVGLPLEGVALIGGIDRILDMARTCVNTTGNMACAVVIASTEGELQESVKEQESVLA
ncbi:MULTISPECIES: dicarboxylate/amino acid:cation symporter [Tepidanaerobacter]|uniref:dicarboxylate/amino acid:cation symporter n=1 Tax=Tepidanaerobacter TaxID=499228 RepID=UPI000B143965|nr:MULTISPECIES: dicarboxylate/amino acid:cation symporter [Tepidanaerobacter]GLI51512.1 dicarboxylate:amino acid:cation symporter DAACS family protein [Tepidanaerobacter syntrophicus]HHV82643.1 dicarboxylate/amino acid:cation symporter [Tepidanaerobacter syntrophicus]